MSLVLNDEQTMLADSARQFLAARSPPSLQRALRDRREPLGFDPALWQDAVALGWAGAALPEDVGGLGAGYQGLGAVFEQMGRQLAALPLLSGSVLCAELLVAAGTGDQRARWLPALLDGRERLALALDEQPGRHIEWRAMQCRASPAKGGWCLTGEKGFVIDGVGADAYLVAVRFAEPAGTADGLGLFIVPAGSDGLGIHAQRLVDSRNYARLLLRDVHVAAAQRLLPAASVAALGRALDRARALLAAESLGILRGMFETTVAYLKERVQFDVPIGSFQALQHRVARLFVELELLDSCVRGALDAIDRDSPDASVMASLAKARASDLAQTLGNEAIQLHGGIGVTDELDLGLYVKRARVLQHLLGDGLFHRHRFAEARGF